MAEGIMALNDPQENRIENPSSMGLALRDAIQTEKEVSRRLVKH